MQTKNERPPEDVAVSLHTRGRVPQAPLTCLAFEGSFDLRIMRCTHWAVPRTTFIATKRRSKRFYGHRTSTYASSAPMLLHVTKINMVVKFQAGR